MTLGKWLNLSKLQEMGIMSVYPVDTLIAMVKGLIKIETGIEESLGKWFWCG